METGLIATYVPELVVTSFVVAVAASYAALKTTGRIRASDAVAEAQRNGWSVAVCVVDPHGQVLAAAPGVGDALVIARRDGGRWTGQAVALWAEGAR